MLGYVPQYTRTTNTEQNRQLMRQNPFATLITVVDGTPLISHLPLVLDETPGKLQIVGHMSRGNKHYKMLEDHISVAIFHGPHTYINPAWYASVDVPTWNYCVVHANIQCRLDTAETPTREALQLLSKAVTELGYEPWEFMVPEDLAGPGELTRAIVSFRADIIGLEGKFKLNQNRSVEDRQGVMTGLRKRGDRASDAVAQLMQETFNET